MLNLVPNADEKAKIIRGISINWRPTIVETPFQLPVFVCARLRLIEYTAPFLLLEIPVLNALLAEIGM
jgi:hypothetical protein